MRRAFSFLRNIFGRRQTPALADETPLRRFWRRVIMALLPPLSMLLSFVALALLLPHEGNNWILPLGLMFPKDLQ